MSRRPRPWISQYDVPRGLEDAQYIVWKAVDPLLVLRGLSDLWAMWKEVEALAVSDSRANGATWEEVAEAMRRTRQSVHRQYAAELPEDEDTGLELVSE